MRTKTYQINQGRFFGTVILLGLLLAMTAFIFSDFIHIDFSLDRMRETLPTEYAVIQVSEGDSLWSLAQTFTREGTDLRRSVETICQVNSLENYVIHPGDELLIPLY